MEFDIWCALEHLKAASSNFASIKVCHSPTEVLERVTCSRVQQQCLTFSLQNENVVFNQMFTIFTTLLSVLFCVH